MPRDLPDDASWIDDYFLAIGRRLLEARIRQNLTQETVYLAAQVDRRTLQAVEAGAARPTVATLLRIAYVLDVPPGDLFG